MMLIKELQKKVDDWINEYGIRYYDELTNMAVLSEEVGEVARIVSRQYGEQSFKENEHNDLGEELADVLFVILCLANQTNTDLEKSFFDKMKKRSKRDKQRHLNNNKLKV